MAAQNLEAAGKKTSGNAYEFLNFNVGDKEFAIPVEDIREIIAPPPFTPVPNVDNYIKGVINLRGRILPLINLAAILHLETKKITQQTRIIVTDINRRQLGMIIDGVSGVMTIDPDAVNAPPDVVIAKIGIDYLSGIYQQEKRLIILLNIRKMIT